MREATGARIEIVAGGRSRVATLASGGSYLSSGDPGALVGLGPIARIDGIRVRYPGGEVEDFPGGAVDRALVLRRGTGTPAAHAEGTKHPTPAWASRTATPPMSPLAAS